ncbi:MAG: hypothetical protein LBG18_09185 [Mediterranea sp.]|jgi:hypothetical protein|nr:hypothetical protein [Mediterranea sp.]
MKKFSELGVKQEDERKLFNCQQVSITDVVNCEIEVLDYVPNIKTKHGDGRYLIHYKQEGAEGKFFSNSTNIKNALDQISKEDFPFTTIIKATKCGNGKIFQFT